MDILTHIVSGVAASTVVAALSKSKVIPLNRIFAVGALGGAFPDIDAITLWSKFDAIIGEGFGLTHTGKEIYFGKFWYSHHAFFHSIAAAVLAGFLFGSLVYLYRWILLQQRKESFGYFFKTNLSVFLAFVLGCMAHIAGDLITPASEWGGVRLFFPHAAYIGGWGKIWWWNNYDIFLIISAGALLNSILLSLVVKNYRRIRMMALLIAAMVFFGVWRQVTTRTTDYAYTGDTGKFQQLEQKSKEEQQRILGEKLYKKMEKLDGWLKFNF